ncbi:MAG TPA: thiamine phosphate synthase [Blastocatellia bacterium]|nr:thiamine phosphate synthase [Blastocatellia bacterium]
MRTAPILQLRSMSLSLPLLYPITDARLSGRSHAEQVERLASAGATFIQLRDKSARPNDFYEAAREAVAVARRLGVRVIINDRLDIALAVKADGVHLGQDDLPPEAARRVAGPGFIIGYSTHSLEQALRADSAPVDYIAVGPVFQTSTKENPDPVVGLGGVRAVKDKVSKPLVAIGGITLESSRRVIEAGADSLAIISDLYSTGEIAERVRRYFVTLEGPDTL